MHALKERCTKIEFEMLFIKIQEIIDELQIKRFMMNKKYNEKKMILRKKIQQKL